MVVFSCQEHCIVSDLICFVREMVFCFRFLTWYHCCFRWLFLGFWNFFVWFELGCLKSLSLSNCFIGLGVVLGWICFSSRHRFHHLLAVSPSLPCFLLVCMGDMLLIIFKLSIATVTFITFLADQAFQLFIVGHTVYVKFHRGVFC